jgi:uncharacterized protein (DUF433 family)
MIDLIWKPAYSNCTKEGKMNFIGKGIYTISDIHAITHISLSKITRWANGYTYRLDGGKRRNIPPIYKMDFDVVDTKKILSFLDLVEILFIDSFERYGFSLQNIRKAADGAARLLGTAHPFAKKCFFTDGKTILIKIAEKNNIPELLDLLKKQYQMEPIVNQFLLKSLDFDKYDLAEKWWPLGKKSGIVVDPKRNFGKPIINDKNIDEIAEWYELDKKTINEALRFYERDIA